MLMRKKNQRLSVFLYQLVNLVLETCFIFSKWCLKGRQDKKCLLFWRKRSSCLNVMAYDFKIRANQRFLLGVWLTITMLGRHVENSFV